METNVQGKVKVEHYKVNDRTEKTLKFPFTINNFS